MMKTEIKREEHNLVRMEIEIPAEEVQKEYDMAVRKISQHANIAGFRKGKAPKNVIERQYGVDTIKYEAMESMLPYVFSQVIGENKLNVITQPAVEKYEFELGQPLKVTATVELKPEVTLGEYKDMTIEVDEYKHPDDAFEKSLNGFLERSATLQDVTDRKVKETDICKIDFDGYVDGEKLKGGEGNDYTLDLAHSSFIPGFAEQIVGHELNEEFDINVTFPEVYHEPSLANKPAVFKIKLNKIQERVLPELNDEFAKKAGPFNTVDELKADIQKFLDDTKKREDDAIIKKAVFEKVLENAKVDIQDSMIEREAQELLNEYKQRLAAQGFNYDDVMKTQDEDKIMADIKKDAETRLKSTLVVEKIAKEEKLNIETQDFDSKLAQVQSMYNLDKNTMLSQLKANPSIISGISQQILSEKVIDFLTEHNKINLK
ncbi:trigger factor [bacterium]|nr:trigger factor [bacterium]